MISIRARIFHSLVRRFFKAKYMEKPEVFRAAIQSRSSKLGNAKPGRRHRRAVNVSESRFEDHRIWTLVPKARDADGPAAARHLFYLHGGGYVAGLAPFHINLLVKLVQQSGVTVHAFNYPLAPDSVSSQTVSQAARAFQHVAEMTGTSPENLILAGESAGGGLCLSVLQHLEAAGDATPRDLILLVPWLNLACDTIEAQRIDLLDPFLGLKGTRVAAEAYAGGRDLKDPLHSPLFGSVAAIHRLYLAAGTIDILHPDAVELKARAEASGANVTWHEGQGLMHGFMFAPVPEAKAVLRELTAFISAAR